MTYFYKLKSDQIVVGIYSLCMYAYNQHIQTDPIWTGFLFTVTLHNTGFKIDTILSLSLASGTMEIQTQQQHVNKIHVNRLCAILSLFTLTLPRSNVFYYVHYDKV